MVIETERDRVDLLRDIGQKATLNDKETVDVIYSDAFKSSDPTGNGEVETEEPFALTTKKIADGIVHGDTLKVIDLDDEVVEFFVRGREPDGTGMVRLILSEVCKSEGYGKY